MKKNFESTLEEMQAVQKKKLLHTAQRILSHLTEEDILQPQDYLELETNAEFRYEEGVLHGLESALAATRAPF